MKIYSRNGNTITDGESTFLIAERKHVTPTKSKYFLLRKIGSRKTYVSSLYGKYPDYEFEYQGTRFKLCLADTTATITRKELSHV
jgi:hypothetical protein